MNTIDTSQLLVQLRAAATAAAGQPAQPAGAAEQTSGANFSSLLSQSIDKVNASEQESSALKEAFQMGDPNVTLPQVALAGAKAKLSFEAMLQVRNKMVEAYQEVMRMQV